MNLFSEMSLPEEVKRGLSRIGFEKPTKIQNTTMPILLDKHDLMACSETGSGKTAAYSVPMVTQLLMNPKKSGLVLAPTRELAQQIGEFIRSLVGEVPGIPVVLLVGGQDIRKQFKALQRKPRIVVATPGRLFDHLKRNTVQIHRTEMLVLDEGDRMIDMGFAPQLEQILKFLPSDRQTCIFTATLPENVQKLAKKYLKNPKKITVGRASLPVSSIKQTVVPVTLKEKDEVILDELNKRSGSIVVFVRTKYRTDRLKKYLSDFGYDVDLIHGGRTQGQRNRALANFRKGKTRILCATDVAARGLDVPQVEHVINFDLPDVDEDYVHRIGRTARNGAEGEAVTFVMPQEYRAWQILVRKYKITGVPELEKPKDKGLGGKGKKRGSSQRRGQNKKLSTKRTKKVHVSKWDQLTAEFGDSNSGKKKSSTKSQRTKKLNSDSLDQFGNPIQKRRSKKKAKKSFVRSSGGLKKKSQRSPSNSKRTHLR